MKYAFKVNHTNNNMENDFEREKLEKKETSPVNVLKKALLSI